jgi:hypothetical protein
MSAASILNPAGAGIASSGSVGTLTASVFNATAIPQVSGDGAYLISAATSDTPLRWAVGTQNEEAGAANAGSDLRIWAYDDGTNVMYAPIAIERSTGIVTCNRGVSMAGGLLSGLAEMSGGTTGPAGVHLHNTGGGLTLASDGGTDGVTIAAAAGPVTLSAPAGFTTVLGGGDGGITLPTRARVTAATTLGPESAGTTFGIVVAATSFTITLPPVATAGYRFEAWLCNAAGGIAVTFAAAAGAPLIGQIWGTTNASSTFFARSTITLATNVVGEGSSVSAISDGVNWFCTVNVTDADGVTLS